MRLTNFFWYICINKNKIVPKTEIVGQTERYVKVGSTVILRCVVRGALEPPSYIMWYHADKQIAPETRGGWRIDIEKGLAGSSDDNHSTVSTDHRYIFFCYIF